jgi:hypothetical protein
VRRQKIENVLRRERRIRRIQPWSVFPSSWLWYGPAGCVFTMLIGYLLSLARPAPELPTSVADLARRRDFNAAVERMA